MPAIGGLMLGSSGITWFLSVAPAAIVFLFAVVAAVLWCMWLEDHEESEAR